MSSETPTTTTGNPFGSLERKDNGDDEKEKRRSRGGGGRSSSPNGGGGPTVLLREEFESVDLVSSGSLRAEWLGTSPGPQSGGRSGVEGRGVRDDGLTSDVSSGILRTTTTTTTPAAKEYTVEDAIDYIGFGAFQMCFLAVTGLSWLCDAMEMMLLSFIGPAARCEWALTTTQASSLTSFVFLGMGFGAPSFGMLADRKGRLFSLRCSTGLTLLAGVGSALAPTFSGLCFARMLVGFGLGGVPVAYNLCAEFLPSKNRGVYLSSL